MERGAGPEGETQGTEPGSQGLGEPDHEFQELVRELNWVRKHNMNLQVGDPEESCLAFAEGALALIALGRLLRMILRAEAPSKDSLLGLLEKATSKKDGLVFLAAPDRERAVAEITKVRNTLLRGNPEETSSKAKRATDAVDRRNPFLLGVEAVYQLTKQLVRQIEHRTGKVFLQG